MKLLHSIRSIEVCFEITQHWGIFPKCQGRFGRLSCLSYYISPSPSSVTQVPASMWKTVGTFGSTTLKVTPWLFRTLETWTSAPRCGPWSLTLWLTLRTCSPGSWHTKWWKKKGIHHFYNVHKMTEITICIYFIFNVPESRMRNVLGSMTLTMTSMGGKKLNVDL